ncbi:hypothetical protein ACLKA6_003528 [Drosophila palustris]
MSISSSGDSISMRQQSNPKLSKLSLDSDHRKPFAQLSSLANLGVCWGRGQEDASLRVAKNCSCSINVDQLLRWSDKRVEKGAQYSLWQTGSDEEDTILASFYDSVITRYEAVTVVPSSHFLLA